MYYWSRTGSLVDLLSFTIICILWASGGWLIINHTFHLKQRERLVAGLAAGFLLFITWSNLLSQILPLPAAYWLGAIIPFVTGLGLAFWINRLNRAAWLKYNPDKWWPQFAVLAVIILVFTLILRGLAIFDDYYHLPMISVMATGDIPPHFYLDPSLHLPYHYGLQVFAASMVRLGGLFPWSAWDISRAIVFGFACVLSWLLIRRMTGSNLAGYLGAGLLVFGGGTRWLLLLIPTPLLQQLGANLHMDISGITAGGSLVADLTNQWPMDGAGPFPFPFAFANGLLEALNMQLGATGAMWEMTILLLLLLSTPRRSSLIGTLTLSLLLASLALSAEHVFAALVAGIALVFIIKSIVASFRRRKIRLAAVSHWEIPVIISASLALFQGGYITGGFMSVISKLTGRIYPMVMTDFQGFSLRWPPAVPTGHLGPLSLFDPGQVVILLAEAGPALFLLILIAIYWLKKLPKSHRLPRALTMGAILSFAFPVFFRYGLDFDITRLVGAALWLSFALAFPILWRGLSTAKQGWRIPAVLAYSAAVYTGLVMLAVELIAIPSPQTTYYLKYTESDFARAYWNRLEAKAQILDDIPERAVLLFGRPSFAAADVYKKSPTWQALVNDPDPSKVAAAGYSYVYMDEQWWQRLSPQVQAAYTQPCVEQLAEMNLSGNQFRRLLRVKACSP